MATFDDLDNAMVRLTRAARCMADRLHRDQARKDWCDYCPADLYHHEEHGSDCELGELDRSLDALRDVVRDHDEERADAAV